ncbi:MAG TPA: hydrogenase 4 subunit F, partial [Gammaproteobacteria bacterium]|nr:hydrogenase 4 subunit F [Gammaproteobacteria bacterium]
STVEHMGIILTACGLGTPAAHLGTVYQLFAHALTKSFCFYAAGLAAITLGTQRIRGSSGLLGSSPLVGWALLLGALAIAGAPPFAIFISEFQILRAGFGAGEYLATGLLTVFIVVAFIAIVYQIGGIVFRQPAPERAPAHPLPVSSVFAMAIAFLPLLVFGFYLPPPLLRLVHQAAALLGGTP